VMWGIIGNSLPTRKMTRKDDAPRATRPFNGAKLFMLRTMGNVASVNYIANAQI